MAHLIGCPPPTPEAWVQSPLLAARVVGLLVYIYVLIFYFNAFQVLKALVLLERDSGCRIDVNIGGLLVSWPITALNLSSAGLRLG